MFFRLFAKRFAPRVAAASASCTACYDSCNNAYLTAEAEGKTAVLCQATSPFFGNLTSCQVCQGSDIAQINANSPFATDFAPFISFCESQNASQPDDPWISVASQASAISSLNLQASSLGFSLVNPSACTTTSSSASTTSTTTQSTTQSTSTLAGSTTVSITSGPTSTTPTPTPQPQNQAWIAGAVLGPLAIIIGISIAIFLLLRRRRRRNPNGPEIPDDGSYKDKAQLHSDSIVPPKPHHELQGSAAHPEEASSNPIWELPGIEMEPLELPARAHAEEAEHGGE